MKKIKFDLPSYELEFHKKINSNRLIIVLSHKDNYAFYNKVYNDSVLFVRDKRHNYYSLYCGSLTDKIQEIIYQNNFSNIIYLGLSKAGYGSLILSGLLAKRDEHLKVKALSFSPLSQLYPINPDTDFPSYLSMIKRSEKNPTLKKNLKQYGILTPYLELKNLYWRIVYCELNNHDKKEAEKLTASNIQKYPLPFSFHGSTIPFTLNRKDSKHIIQEVNNIYLSTKKDKDLKATLPKYKTDLILQLTKALWIPSLTQALDEVLDI